MPTTLKVFQMLQVAHSALFRAADQRTRDRIGMSTTQLAVLFILARQDGQPISDISKTLAMGKSSLTGLIDRMCDKGLVRRAACEADGRVTNIYLEPAGHDAAALGRRETMRYNKALIAPFAPREQEVIQRFLTHLTENAETIITGAQAHD